jgi:hypothetical protein
MAVSRCPSCDRFYVSTAMRAAGEAQELLAVADQVGSLAVSRVHV